MGVGLKGFTLLEISYEVANKVGGIYTVLVSKMSQAMEFAGNYYTIGPYHENAAASEFIREAAPKALKDAFLELENRHGISCHYGRWNIEKKPYAILVEPGKMNAKTNEIKHHLWEEYGIDSLGADDWFNEPAVWAECVGLLIEQMTRFGFLKGNIIAHFHEWLSGAGLLHLKSARSKIRTVFTTHSTVLGRTIAETGREDLYGMIKNGLEKGQTAQKEKVYQYQVQAKHMMEKASALNADVFTTVSETMAEECLFILGRKPLVLNNGLDMKKFPQAEEAFCLHEKCTKLIKNFLLGYFLPYYDVDFDNSLVVFISGRHEFRNKGIDIFIGALGKLNEGLRKSGAKKPIAAFIWVPASTGGRKPTVVEHLRTFNKARQAIESETERVEKDILKLFIRGETSRIPAVIDADRRNGDGD
jgi:glycogen(starch) synthase